MFHQCWSCDSTSPRSVLSIVSIHLVLQQDILTEPTLDVRDYLLYNLHLQGAHDLCLLHYIHHLYGSHHIFLCHDLCHLPEDHHAWEAAASIRRLRVQSYTCPQIYTLRFAICTTNQTIPHDPNTNMTTLPIKYPSQWDTIRNLFFGRQKLTRPSTLWTRSSVYSRNERRRVLQNLSGAHRHARRAFTLYNSNLGVRTPLSETLSGLVTRSSPSTRKFDFVPHANFCLGIFSGSPEPPSLWTVSLMIHERLVAMQFDDCH